MEQNKIRIEGIRWSSCDRRTWLGTTPYMVYTIEPVVRGWVLDAGGEKEILPSLVEAKQRALEDYRIRSERMRMTMGPKYGEYDEKIGGV